VLKRVTKDTQIAIIMYEMRKKSVNGSDLRAQFHSVNWFGLQVSLKEDNHDFIRTLFYGKWQ